MMSSRGIREGLHCSVIERVGFDSGVCGIVKSKEISNSELSWGFNANVKREGKATTTRRRTWDKSKKRKKPMVVVNEEAESSTAELHRDKAGSCS